MKAGESPFLDRDRRRHMARRRAFGRLAGPDSPHGGQPRLWLERLEDRTLLAATKLVITTSAQSLTAGVTSVSITVKLMTHETVYRSTPAEGAWRWAWRRPRPGAGSGTPATRPGPRPASVIAAGARSRRLRLHRDTATAHARRDHRLGRRVVERHAGRDGQPGGGLEA